MTPNLATSVSEMMRPRVAAESPEVDVQSQRTLHQLLMGNRIQQSIYVAARLGIADLVKEAPRTASDLAQASGCHPDSLYRLLRALASYGIFAEDDSGRFSVTPIARLLQRDARGSLRAAALWSGEVTYKVFAGLEETVRTGEPAFDRIFGMEFFEYLLAQPEVGALFDEFMARQTAMLASVLPSVYDFSDVDVIADIGGGKGELLAAILKRCPRARGVLFDQPRVIAGATGYLGNMGVLDRCRIVAGDIAEGVPPGADIYLWKSIVHALRIETAADWLRRCRSAMNDHSKLLLMEYVITPGNSPHPGKLMDVLMLLGTHGGRERTEEQFRDLLTASGFSLGRVITTESMYSIIEAVPTQIPS